MHTHEERFKQAQMLLQLAMQTLERDYGFAIETSLQIEAISSSYATSRAVIALKPIPNWQPIPAPDAPLSEHNDA